MERSISRKRPWLAALLAALVTGLGHLYLRRWRRALGWLAVLFGVTVLLVDPGVVDALASGNAVDPLAIAPILVVGGLSVVDAYLLARVHNEGARRSTGPGEQLAHCPNCGKELDPDIDFCPWCTTAVGDRESAQSERGDGQDE